MSAAGTVTSITYSVRSSTRGGGRGCVVCAVQGQLDGSQHSTACRSPRARIPPLACPPPQGIALILGCVYAGSGEGSSITGISGLSTGDKVWGCMNALGSLGFAYGFSTIGLEIQVTKRGGPGEGGEGTAGKMLVWAP